MLIGNPLGEGSHASSTNWRPITELWGAENSFFRMRGKVKSSEGSGMLIGNPLGEGSNASSTSTRAPWGRGTSRDTCLLCPSPTLRPGRARTPGCSGSDLDFIESLTQVFQQISLVRLKHRHSVQRSDGLTCCCICPAI